MARGADELDRILRDHRRELGGDFTAYRNHACRVVSLCDALAPPVRGHEIEKVIVAAAFHDLGIWTAQTFDYLEPSAALAREYLVATGREQWVEEITSMIQGHHKLTSHGADQPLAERFRRADWIDVSRGLRRFGVPRSIVRNVFTRWPSAGFHWRLVQLTARRFRAHPLNPLPMFRL